MAADAPAVRFAPSPTGLLHVGNARVALANWLFARSCGGRFTLRHDDTDAARSGEAYRDAIERDLRWLDLDWDARVRQSERGAAYAAAAGRLRASGRLYPCFETPEELAAQRHAQIAAGRPPAYDRAALALSEQDRAALAARGRRPHWRFRLAPEHARWRDAVHGNRDLDPAATSDPVLVRADGGPLYTLTSVVDDIELGITHVLRGDDHLTNTATQLQIFAALGAEPPSFAHLPLLVGATGESLSKRLGALSLASLRDEGTEPLALAALLARLGTSDPVTPFAGLTDLAAGFDLSRFGAAPVRFDPRELRALNARFVRTLPIDSVRERLPGAVPAAEAEAFWAAVRPNLARVADAGDWAAIVYGPLAPAPPEGPDRSLLHAAAERLPPEPWDGETWAGWTAAVASATGATGRRLLQPLRLALTGRGDGPEMKKLLPLIGRARAVARLRGATA